MIRPVLSIVLLLQIIWDLRVFAQIRLLQDSGAPVKETNLLGNYIFELGIGRQDFACAAAVSILVLALTVAAVVAVRAQPARGGPVMSATTAPHPRPGRARPARRGPHRPERGARAPGRRQGRRLGGRRADRRRVGLPGLLDGAVGAHAERPAAVHAAGLLARVADHYQPRATWSPGRTSPAPCGWPGGHRGSPSWPCWRSRSWRRWRSAVPVPWPHVVRRHGARGADAARRGPVHRAVQDAGHGRDAQHRRSASRCSTSRRSCRSRSGCCAASSPGCRRTWRRPR